MASQPLAIPFLKAVIASRKSLGLYPAGSETATAWIQRLHRSLDGFFEQGLRFPVRVGRDRFTCGDEPLLTVDPALEDFRRDLEIRGIAGFSIAPGVAEWELRAFLELLSVPPEELGSLAGAGAYLRTRGVVNVSVEAPGAGGGVGGGEGGVGGGEGDWSPDSSLRVLETGKDEVDLFVEGVLEKTDERLAELTYDRMGLSRWLETVGEGGRVAGVYDAVRMLGSMADRAADREIRGRTVVESVLQLPEPLLQPLLTDRLLPLAATDRTAFNLLSQVTGDELRRVARLVPADRLLAFTTDLVEFPWEEGKRQRLVEAIASVLHGRDRPDTLTAETVDLAPDDPILVELRQEIVAACHPDGLLERSADILLALVFNVDSEEYPAFAVDALEEIIGEALARGRLDLAVRALTALGASRELGGARMREHARYLARSRQRMAGRTHVSLVAGSLRQPMGTEQLALAAEYLRLVPPEGVAEFASLLAEERDRRVRGRMCQVLAKVGPFAVPSLLGWLSDTRWFVVRNVAYILARIGDRSTFAPLAGVLDHPHPRVRLEVVRALPLLGGGDAIGPLLRTMSDPDPTVCREVVKLLGGLRTDEAVPALRELIGRRPASATWPDEGEVKREAVGALATIGSPFARAALAKVAERRVWFWQRRERQLRAWVVAALGAGWGVDGAESDDG
jgi:HEAT repeats